MEDVEILPSGLFSLEEFSEWFQRIYLKVEDGCDFVKYGYAITPGKDERFLVTYCCQDDINEDITLQNKRDKRRRNKKILMFYDVPTNNLKKVIKHWNQDMKCFGIKVNVSYVDDRHVKVRSQDC